MIAPSQNAAALTSHIVRGPLFTSRQGRRITFESKPPAAPVIETTCRPAVIARKLALAHHLQQAIDNGKVSDRAAVARGLGLTRARLTQLLDLLVLAPDIQEELLFMEAIDGVEPVRERTLRALWRQLARGGSAR